MLPFLTMLLLAAPASAGPRCASVLRSPTAFEVTVSSFPTVIDRRLDIEEVNRLRPVKPPPKSIAHGLSVAEYRLRVTTREEALADDRGENVCAWIVSVDVDLTPEAIRVFIPKEYKASSCESRELVRHEMEHERLHRRRLAEAAERMRAALRADRSLPGPGSPIGADAAQDAYSKLKTRVDAAVRPIYARFVRSVAAEQETLDDETEYERLGAACSGWRRL